MSLFPGAAQRSRGRGCAPLAIALLSWAAATPDAAAAGTAGTNDASFFVPIVLSSAGAGSSFYTSELTLTNKGTTTASVELTYTAAFGDGSGAGTDTLPPGRQKVVPDAIEYLRTLGIPIPAEGGRGGTLRVRFSGLASPTDGFVAVRTTTAVAEGRAGLAYAGVGAFPAAGPSAPPLPASTVQAPLPSGTYRSTNYDTGTDSFPAPAPGPSIGTSLAAFVGTSPNGTWSLFVVDDSPGDLGRFAGGWCLNLWMDDATSAQRCNPASIEVPNAGSATPYPSAIVVSGLTGRVSRITATLSHLTHGCPADLDLLLAGPGGQTVVVMSDAGRCGPSGGASDVTLTFDDYASTPSTLFGLRQNATDRSNVAVTNAGEAADGNITLRLTVRSGVAGQAVQATLPDFDLPPGGFRQFSGILGDHGLTNGTVRVERVSGTAPYVAYAVVNDQANSDGSFVPAVADGTNAGRRGLTLPVVVESGVFTTEVTVANVSSSRKDLDLTYVSENIQGGAATARLAVQAGEQLILPSFVQYLRDHGASGIAAKGPTFAGALFATVSSGDVSGLLIGGRTSNPGGGGQYGVFYPATAYGDALRFDSAWLYGLRQDPENRTNVALVNTGETDGSTDTFRVEFVDGQTGLPAGSPVTVTVPPRGWKQVGSVLADAAPDTPNAYARVTRTAGANPYLAYTVINDGAGPGQRSGDGAFLGGVFDPSNLGFAGTWTGTTNETRTVSLTVAGSQVTAFSMPIVLRYGSLTCVPVLTLPAPAAITGTDAALVTSSGDHPGPGLSGVKVSLAFTSSTTVAGTLGAMTLAGGLACDAGFSFGTATATNGPWTFTATRQ